jgi:uncharacterized membrane protein
MDFKKLFEVTWQTTLSFIGPMILLTLAYTVVIVFSLGIMAPVTTAGYMRSLLRVLREGRSPELKDLFSEMSLFLPLCLFFLLAMIAISIGFMFLVLPGFLVMGFITFAALYMIPLMLDQRLGVVDALQESWEMAVRDPLMDQVIIVIVYLAITSLGGSVPFGVLITQPFATLLILGAYEKRGGGPLYGPMGPPPPPMD